MDAAQPVIVGLGMVTAIGLSVAETAAAARARMMRFTETELLDANAEPFTLATVPDDVLPPLADKLSSERSLSARERRLLRLGTKALKDAIAGVVRPGERPGLSLALPDTKTQLPLDNRSFLERFAIQVDGAFNPAGSDASHLGRAGGMVALSQALLTIATGRVDMMIVGGIDTYRDLFVLGVLDSEGRVKSTHNLDGFIPGEAAAFALITTRRVAEQRGVRVIGDVSRVAMGFETGHLYSDEPYRGEALASILAQLSASSINDVYSSMNGESFWAKEWGIALIRNRSMFAGDPPIHHPADCFGDIGAAMGPALLGLCARAQQDGYRRGPSLLYCSSDRGARAAVVVSQS
jgi:3-oxoacyl-[acyl-carrier-protein] synthase I